MTNPNTTCLDSIQIYCFRMYHIRSYPTSLRYFKTKGVQLSYVNYPMSLRYFRTEGVQLYFFEWAGLMY